MELLRKLYVTYPTRGRKCDGCNLGQDYYSDGFRTIPSGFFFHAKCAKSSPEIYNLYHPQHSLKFKLVAENEDVYGKCNLCTGNLPKMYYNCSICDFSIDLICASKEVIVKIDGGKAHNHPLFLVPEMIRFTCHLCEMSDDRFFPYACTLCDVSFHKDCGESTSELNYSCHHPKHILKRLTTSVPNYSINGKCCLCESKLHIIFYHCSICNFSVDVDCAKNPPSFTLLHPKTHEHSLTFMPQRSFICNACGMDDDPNPYVCPQCNFMIHRNCIDIPPHVIKTSRHHHRINYNHYHDPGHWECEVCHKEINWTCGAYYCLECPHFAIHLRCATRSKIWDVKDTTEDTLEVKSYEEIEEGVIKHYSHENHALHLKEANNGISDARMRCIACTYPIISSSYYICMSCDDFILHKKCAYLPKKKIDSIYKMSITLNTDTLNAIIFCDICKTHSQGFFYQSDNNENVVLDVRCGSISEPISHESHPLHSLYINYVSTGDKVCNACGDKANIFISCEDCDFFLDIRCSILPKLVKHKNDEDHFISLCYGGNQNGQYWCEICEEQINPKKWFYSCVHCDITFHIKCALGDFMWIKPEDQSNEFFCVLIKNGITRPLCASCGLRCQLSTILKFGKFILCSQQCLQRNFKVMVEDM